MEACIGLPFMPQTTPALPQARAYIGQELFNPL
jgi:hypothetical protein